MNPLATYSFLSFLRQGIANTIASADGDPSVKTRATIPVALQVDGDPVGGGAELTAQVTQNIALFGPGDIVGIENRAIFRTDPHPRVRITNYESNYLAAVEFYDEDFPWRYTPARSEGQRLRSTQPDSCIRSTACESRLGDTCSASARSLSRMERFAVSESTLRIS